MYRIGGEKVSERMPEHRIIIIKNKIPTRYQYDTTFLRKDGKNGIFQGNITRYFPNQKTPESLEFKGFVNSRESDLNRRPAHYE